MALYLDYNASTPIHPDVLETMITVYRQNFGNADSRTHTYGDNARQAVEKARHSIANLLNVNNTEVFFTSGATESDNIAILGLKEYAKKTQKKHIITSSIEHKAVLQPVKKLESHGFDVTYINPDSSGSVRSEDVINAVRKDTLLVSVMHVNNETGIIQPIKEIGDFLSDTNVLFHIDAAQSFGKMIFEIRNSKYDLLSASAHKVYGPQGVGILVMRKKKYRLPPVDPIMHGGNQEHGLRPGTLPTALIAGFGKAAEIMQLNHSAYWNNYLKNKETVLEIVRNSGVKYIINGDQNLCIPNTINISFTGVNSEALMLAARSYCGISNGSACNSSNYSQSYVLDAMKYAPERIQSSVRISWGYEVFSVDDVIPLISCVKSLQ